MDIQQHPFRLDTVEQSAMQPPGDTEPPPVHTYGKLHEPEGPAPVLAPHVVVHRRGECGVRHLFAALDLAKDKLYGHIKPVKRRTQFLEFCRYLRTLYP